VDGLVGQAAGQGTVRATSPVPGADYRLTLRFDDDAGQRWQKYARSKDAAYGPAIAKAPTSDDSDITAEELR
jgi:hypothetical protein